ncbi:29468_t:CDS:1, partial [Gigaspora margarita]
MVPFLWAKRLLQYSHFAFNSFDNKVKCSQTSETFFEDVVEPVMLVVLLAAEETDMSNEVA